MQRVCVHERGLPCRLGKSAISDDLYEKLKEVAARGAQERWCSRPSSLLSRRWCRVSVRTRKKSLAVRSISISTRRQSAPPASRSVRSCSKARRLILWFGPSMHQAPSTSSAKRGKSEVGISEKCLTKSWSGGPPMVVIDANAALEMAFEGERGDALRALLLQGEEAIAPSVFHSEVSNACFKYAAFGSMWARKKRRSCSIGWDKFLVDCFHDDASLAKEALSESIRYRHPAYDMFYLVLARRTGATLFTLDKKMWALARDMHVNCIEEADRRSDRVAVLRSTAPHLPLSLTFSLQQSVLCPVNCPKQFAVSLISVG